MSKSSARGGFLGRKSGMVTVLETRVHHNSARNAKLAFWVSGLVVGILGATIGTAYTHPIVAGVLGIVAGAVVGGIFWALVRAWPVLRVLWWWATEIILGTSLVYGWLALVNATNLPVLLIIVSVLVGVPAAVGPIRRRIEALFWCVAVRHRLRVAFSQFIIANRSGSLPLILLARPTPVGERVWILLRAGLSQSSLESQADKLASVCHATTVQVERVGSNSAYLRLDIKRREVLDKTVASPLVDLVDPATPRPVPRAVTLPTALNLADVPDEPLVTTYKPSSKTNGATSTGSPVNGAAPDDSANEWI